MFCWKKQSCIYDLFFVYNRLLCLTLQVCVKANYKTLDSPNNVKLISVTLLFSTGSWSNHVPELWCQGWFVEYRNYSVSVSDWESSFSGKTNIILLKIMSDCTDWSSFLVFDCNSKIGGKKVKFKIDFFVTFVIKTYTVNKKLNGISMLNFLSVSIIGMSSEFDTY